MTFNPTIVKTPITPSTATSESNQSLMTEDATVSKSVEMVRPFLKGIEDNSVLIDITGLPNQQLLREALQAFNKDAHLRKGYNDYIGKVSRTRSQVYESRDHGNMLDPRQSWPHRNSAGLQSDGWDLCLGFPLSSS
ncbi:translation elongation factor Tu [Mucor velutinosus]|uniref:Translation elongation factor Tu n=1 Tax=Mucor velutinosus TaxID=708070 RepID=A0AAN7HW45_9FUNG|nr:translation elongation factor Tu [Mucor velutinosus]